MSRRTRWLAVGAAVVLAAVIAVWVWQASAPRPDPETTTTPTAAPSPSPDVRALAQAELDEHLEQCAADGMPGGTASAGCGIRIPWGTEFATVDDAALRIERLPVLELDPDGQGFVADDGILVATVTGTGQDGAPRTETYRTDSWAVRGDVVLSEGRLRLDVW
ncbi:hypothetical protein [Microbacterium sp. H83]|uniref:hypothetical protein n=1 Tax=Microbacterium sp. H83 TaxID=1827324 RepID=UPI0007F41748|nr:hypothetical protein [Microbacterium sp. H83]OAN33659.1 hypothetical protein A4X16_06635 [Microbacterium sp. H83]